MLDSRVATGTPTLLSPALWGLSDSFELLLHLLELVGRRHSSGQKLVHHLELLLLKLDEGVHSVLEDIDPRERSEKLEPMDRFVRSGVGSPRSHVGDDQTHHEQEIERDLQFLRHDGSLPFLSVCPSLPAGLRTITHIAF